MVRLGVRDRAQETPGFLAWACLGGTSWSKRERMLEEGQVRADYIVNSALKSR